MAYETTQNVAAMALVLCCRGSAMPNALPPFVDTVDCLLANYQVTVVDGENLSVFRPSQGQWALDRPPQKCSAMYVATLRNGSMFMSDGMCRKFYCLAPDGKTVLWKHQPDPSSLLKAPRDRSERSRGDLLIAHPLLDEIVVIRTSSDHDVPLSASADGQARSDASLSMSGGTPMPEIQTFVNFASQVLSPQSLVSLPSDFVVVLCFVGASEERRLVLLSEVGTILCTHPIASSSCRALSLLPRSMEIVTCTMRSFALYRASASEGSLGAASFSPTRSVSSPVRLQAYTRYELLPTNELLVWNCEAFFEMRLGADGSTAQSRRISVRTPEAGVKSDSPLSAVSTGKWAKVAEFSVLWC